jgi:hypothetical protein
MRQKLGNDTGSGELKQGEVEPLVVSDEDLGVEDQFRQYIVDGVYMHYEETPGQRQFKPNDRVLVNCNGMVNEPATVSLSYNGIYKDIQITGIACYWIVFDKEAILSASDPRFRPSNIEANYLMQLVKCPRCHSEEVHQLAGNVIDEQVGTLHWRCDGDGCDCIFNTWPDGRPY